MIQSEIEKIPDAVHFMKFATVMAPAVARRMGNEYIAKKRAYEFANTQYRKTGSIDLSRLAQVYTSDDIFLQKTVTKNGKSHGLQFVIDFSASMDISREAIACQFLVTALFCKAANIKFSICTFTGGSGVSSSNNPFPGLSMMEIANSEYRVSELVNSFYHMICAGYARGNKNILSDSYTRFLNHAFWMAGTPLVQAKLNTYCLANELRSKHGIQNVTVMFITDGAGNGLLYGDDGVGVPVTSVVCPYTQRRYDLPNGATGRDYMKICSPINRMYRDAGFKVINLFIGPPDEASRMLNSLDDRVNYDRSSKQQYVDIDDMKHLYKKHGNVVEVTNGANYDTFIAASRSSFPINMTELSDDASARATFNKKMTSTSRMSLIGSIIVDSMCKDFKIVR